MGTRRTPREAITEFDFDALESPVPESPAHAVGRLVLDGIMDVLIGSRINAKELAVRALAVGIVGAHWRLHRKSVAELARRIGVTHTVLYRRVRELRAKGPEAKARSPKRPRGRSGRKV